MADDDGLFLQNLDEFINDEDRIVTYKWLSRTLSVPSNQAKQMLYAYLTKQREDKNANNISATYLVGGRCQIDHEQMVHQYILTNDDNLDDTKSCFDIVTSVHVYSLQKNTPKDSNAFYTVDYNLHQEHQNESNRWSHIYCKESTPLSDGGASRGHCIGKAGKENSVPTVVNGQGSSNSTDSDKHKTTTQKSKKGQLPTMGMFAVKTDKTSSVEDEKTKPKEPSTAKSTVPDKTNKTTKTAGKSKQASGMMSFFGKPISAQKEESKQDKPKEKMPEKSKDDTPEKPKEKIPEKSKDDTPEKPKEKIPEKLQEDTPEKPKEKRPEKTRQSKKTPKNNKTHKQNRRRIKNLDSSDEEEDPVPKKFQKLVSDSESEDEEQPKKSSAKAKKVDKNQEEIKTKKSTKKEKITKDNNAGETQSKSVKTNRKRKKEPKQASSEEESPVRSSTSFSIVRETPIADQSKDKQTMTRKRRKVMRSKTYVDDDGFMVTEKVYESESTDASDEEETVLKQERSQSQPPKKISPDSKPKKVTELKPSKQAGIMSFFKKN